MGLLIPLFVMLPFLTALASFPTKLTADSLHCFRTSSNRIYESELTFLGRIIVVAGLACFIECKRTELSALL